jgi:phenylacetate-CoA ligase
MKHNRISQVYYLRPFSYITFFNAFSSWYHLLKKSQHWTKAQVQKHQSQRIKELISHSVRNVPYYRKLFDSYGIKLDHINKPSDITKLPYITREDIKHNLSQLKAENYPKNAFKKTMTGGTTGSPLELYIEHAQWLGVHFAFNKIYMEQAGYHWADKVVSFTGISERYMYHPFHRTFEISSFYTAKKDFDEWYDKILKFKPSFITSYPSSLTLFTQYVCNLQKKAPVLKAIFLHGETIFDWQRKLLQNYYDCPVFDQYGHRERCVFATTCKHSDKYHVFPEYGLMEIIDRKGNIVTKKGEQGEIVATGFTNKVFPLIRYKTGDIAVVDEMDCECGRQYPVIERIIGRTQEFLVTHTHERVPATGLYHVIAEHSHHIKECQLYQEKEGDLIIYVVKDEGFSEHDEKHILHAFKDRFKDSFSVTLRFIPSIKRTEQGKYRYVIQKIHNSQRE